MNSILFEQPWTLGVAGALVVIILVSGWVKTWNVWLLVGAIASLVGTAALILVERTIETPREEVQRTLAVIAADIESNDPARVVRHISALSPDMIAKAQAELPKHHFRNVKITSVDKIDINERGHDPKAYVEFRVVVEGDFFNGQMSHRVPRFIMVTMHREDGVWKISDYEHHQPLHGMQRDRP